MDFVATDSSFWHHVFGNKTAAFFDIWSFEHFFSGANFAIYMPLITAKIKRFREDKTNKFLFDFLFVLIIELLWEIFEHYVEAGDIIPAWTYWFQGVEAFSNRMFSDPVVTMSGFVFMSYFRNIPLQIFCSIFSVTWLYFHIFVFDHCMYLQEIIVNYFAS